MTEANDDKLSHGRCAAGSYAVAGGAGGYGSASATGDCGMALADGDYSFDQIAASQAHFQLVKYASTVLGNFARWVSK